MSGQQPPQEPPQTLLADGIAAGVVAAVASALGAGWRTAGQLLRAIYALRPSLKQAATEAEVVAALEDLGFVEAQTAALDQALTPAVTNAFGAGWEQALTLEGQAAAANPEDFLRQGALQRALAQLEIDLKGVSRVSVDRIGNALAEAISTGEASAQAAARIEPILHDAKRAKVIARTEIARAMEGALLAQAKASGTGLYKKWLDAPGACPICRANAAQAPMPLDRLFAGGVEAAPQHPNCLIGSTRVVVPADVAIGQSARDAVASLREIGGESATATAVAERHVGWGAARAATDRHYVGQVVVIRTALGYELTATPNHPVATRSGWVPIAELAKGDHVLSSTAAEWVVDAVDPNVDHVPPTIEEVAKSLPVALGPMPTAAEDFHGDGAGSEVHVVRANGLLRSDRLASGSEQIGQSDLRGGHLEPKPLNGTGAAFLGGDRDDSAPHRVVGGLGDALPFLSVGLGHSSEHSCASVSGLDPSVEKDPSDGPSADAEGFCQRLLALSGQITLDQVVSVKREPFGGHVYNLDTPSGWYIGNGIVTHNCRCALALVPH